MNIETLFDYQKIAANPRLEKMIKEVENKYLNADMLGDDDLENVAGGRIDLNATICYGNHMPDRK